MTEFAAAFPGENEYVEFKSSPSRDPLARSMVAFSNAGGGVVLVGVDDKGQLLHRGSVAGWMRAVHETATTIRDLGRYWLRSVKVGDYDVLAVAVNARSNGIAQTSAGLPLVRKGEQDVPLFGADLFDLVRSRAGTRYEETVTGVPFETANSDLVGGLAEVHAWDPTTDLRDVLRSHGMLADAPDEVLTVAGVLFLTSRPRDRMGKTFVEVRRYTDETTTDYDRREEFDGPVNDQVLLATSFIRDELGSDLVVTNLYRYQLPKLPDVVLREAIANAVAHRNYENAGTAVVVELRPSRVVITSPGGLLDPVTEENLRDTQASRNPRIIAALRRYRLAEDAGRGIDVMEDEMRSALLDPPRFKDLGHAFEVTLPVHSPIAPVERAWILDVERQGRLEPQDRLLLVQAAREERLTNAKARAVLNVDHLQARSALKRLCDVGMLRQHGDRGGAYYTLSTDIAPPTFRMSVAQLLQYLHAQARDRPLTNERVRELAGVGRDDARALLAQLVADGRLRKVGQRRGTRYERLDDE